MADSSNHPSFLLLLITASLISLASSAPTNNSKLFREYIGADSSDIDFSDVPINPGVDFHFILAFAVDYTLSAPHFPTDGNFTAIWGDTRHRTLTPSRVASIKQRHHNVRVALSLAGDSYGDISVYFVPFSVDSWVRNAVSSLTRIIKQYHLDGVDVDYEHFVADPDTFAECIGRLLTVLKQEGVISFASIAPFEDEEVQAHYMALWRRYGHIIDYVNFQFYAYDANTTVAQFLSYFEAQSANYGRGKVLVSFSTDRSSGDDGGGGLSPGRGFFNASRVLKMQGKLQGIFIWSADDSKGNGFRYEVRSQELLLSD